MYSIVCISVSVHSLPQGKTPRLEPVELKIASLNSGATFIFERPGHLAVWTGKYVPSKLRHKLKKVMKKIGESRGGQPVVSLYPSHQKLQSKTSVAYQKPLATIRNAFQVVY